MLTKMKESLLTRLIQQVGTAGALLSSRRVQLFAYDEMMNPTILERFGIFSERSVLAWIDGHAPCINVTSDGGKNVGRLGLRKDVGAKAWGVVHEIGGTELLLLDGLLWAAGQHYERRMVAVTDRDGYEYRAWVYVAQKAAAGLQATEDYIQGIVREAQMQGVPDYYAQNLLALVEMVTPVFARTMRAEDERRRSKDSVHDDGSPVAVPCSGH
jgi:hypothetical protein